MVDRDGDGSRSASDPGSGGDPQEMLRLLEHEQARTHEALEPDPRVLFGAWGVAWLVGFLATWAGVSDASPIRIPLSLGGALFAALGIAAAVVTVVHMGRRAAGVRGVSSRVGAMYGWAWALAFGTLFVVMTWADLPDESLRLLWPVLSGLVVGTLYLAGGALWQDRVQYGLGLWILVSSALGAIAGYPSSNLVMGLCGGGGFLAAAAFFAVRSRVRRR